MIELTTQKREPAEHQLPLLEYTPSIGALCHLTDVLLWKRYGYWGIEGEPPEWYPAALRTCEAILPIVQPANAQYDLANTHYEGSHFCGTFRLWDEANPWVQPWEVAFRFQSEAAAQVNYNQRAAELDRLHRGSIAALIESRDTGLAVPPSWLPQSQRYWEDPKWIKAKATRLSKLEKCQEESNC